VFTVEEAETQWPKDPTLPKSKKERDTGILAYNPTVDMGRWNCRHRTRYITPALAIKFRPELAEYFGRKPLESPTLEANSGSKKFTPAKSISEAEQRIKGLGVSYFQPKGFGLDHANATLEALELIPKLAIPDAIGNGKAWSEYSGSDIGRRAESWYGVSVNRSYIQGSGKIDLESLRDGYDKYIVGINTRQYKTIDSITERKVYVQDYYRNKNGRDYFFNTDGRLTHFHEYGHVYDNRLGGISDRTEWSQIVTRWNYDTKVDVLKSKSEAFAEAFADYYGNGGARIPDYVKSFFDVLKN